MANLYDLSLKQLAGLLQEWGEPPFRARQVWAGLYGRLTSSVAEFTDVPSDLRARLQETFEIGSLHSVAQQQSRDGQTVKHLFSLPDGGAIEAVLMRYDRRRTACISTQVGCAMGCVFCATGQMGFGRNLSAGEIVEQVLFYARALQAEGDRLTHVVVMGMGEPFHNYDATMEAVDRLTDPTGLRLGARRITISTVGLVPMIRRFAGERRQVNLAVSLHAATDALRSELLPINRKYPLAELMAACREYVSETSRRITFEWALIQGLNDTPEQATALGEWLSGMNCHVNVIPLNPTGGYSGGASTQERAAAFRATLEQRGIACTIRVRRGIDIDAGCGQLAIRQPLTSEIG